MIGPLLTALRPKQWVKNLFVFLPLIFGKKMLAYPENARTAEAFFLYCMASSCVYLFNDILDAEEDKLHPVKKLRPIASGRLPVSAAVAAAFVLGGTAVFFSFSLNLDLGWILSAYLVLNLLYSRWLKHKVLIDVGCIACFFLMRLAAGHVTAQVGLSHWILFMTALLALFLGFNKRRQELHHMKSASSRHVLLEYDEYLIDQMVSVVTASIVVVYMLYTVDTFTVTNVGNKHLVFSIPFVYYGIFRYLYLVHKAGTEGDPTALLWSDSRMRVNLALWMTVCIAVIYFKA